MDVEYKQETVLNDVDENYSEDENTAWNNSCKINGEIEELEEKIPIISPTFKEDSRKTIIQKCYKLAELTGCSIFVKITDHEESESYYYGSHDYVRDYHDNELRPDERDIAVSGESGAAITFADICTQQPWNMFMWTLNDSNKLSMISNQSDMDMPENGDMLENGDMENGDMLEYDDMPENGDMLENGDTPNHGDMPENSDVPGSCDMPDNMEEYDGHISETDSQKTESADEDGINAGNHDDDNDYNDNIDPDYEPQSKPKDLSTKKEDAGTTNEVNATKYTSPSNAAATESSTVTTESSAVLTRREHDNLLSCLPKYDSIGGLASVTQGEALYATGLMNYGMYLDQTKQFKYSPFPSPRLSISALLNAELPANNVSHSIFDVHRSLGDAAERRFCCEVCGKGFSLLGNLKTHRRIHSLEKPFKCPTCGKGFTQSGNLRAHERIHTGEKPFTCHVCEKNFVQIQHLKSHMRTHSGERPYQCKDCGKAFTQASTLRAHIRIHSGERPYQCKVCAKAFSQSSNLKEHVRIHSKHQKMPLDQAALIAISNGIDIPGLAPLDDDVIDSGNN